MRRVVARRLGVPTSLLGPKVALRGDLATDDAAMLDLVLAVESRLGVRMPEQMLDEIRTYGELVTAMVAAIRDRRARLSRTGEDVATGRVRVTGPKGLVVERSGALTPYVLESIMDDARRSGAGTTVAITMTGPITDERLADLGTQLALLERRGVTVHLARGSEGNGLLRTSS
ncbi:MAG: acyl carrier protein [Candidatus Binatia bacterium]